MNVFVNVVIVSVGNKCDICIVMFSSYCLICVFVVKCNLIVVIGYGFVWGRKRLKIKNVVSINVVKNNEVVCVLYIWDVYKMCYCVRVVCVLFFFILYVYLLMMYLCYY